MNGVKIRDAFISVLFSFLLYKVGVAAFFFTFPLLMLQNRYSRTELLGISSIVLALVVGSAVWQSRALGFSPVSCGVLAIGLFVPVSLLGAEMVWVVKKECEVLKRLLFSMLPALILFFAICMWFVLSQDVVAGVKAHFYTLYAELFENVFTNMSIDVSLLFNLVALALAHMAFACVLGAVMVTHFLALSAVNTRDEEFDGKVAAYHLPEVMIWPFLILWSFVLLERFVSIAPVVSICILNAALSVTLLFGVQGFAILLSFLRKLNPHYKAAKLMMFVLILFLLVPGVNLLVISCIPLLGVLETWITFRK